MYRIGMPFWKAAGQIGMPLKLTVDVFHDTEANVFVATSKDLRGLVAEAETMDVLVLEVQSSVNELLREAFHKPVVPKPVTDLRLCTV